MHFEKVLAQIKGERKPASAILIIIGLVLVAMVLGNLLGGFLMVFVLGIKIADIGNLQSVIFQSDKGWWAMVLAQGIASILTFILAGIFYWKIFERKTLAQLNFKNLPSPIIFALVILIELAFMPFNGWLQHLNENLAFPEAWSSFERVLKSMEESLAETTKFLTDFSGIPQLFVAFMVIAVVAGIGEELIFRGLIQRKLYAAYSNPHLAIWVAAFIFSAIHFQFYGFLPRLFLGALFGYFYYWSGNLWVPIVAHIFNNGFAVMVYYLMNQGYVSKDLEKMDNFPMPVVVVSGFLALFFTWLFRKKTITD